VIFLKPQSFHASDGACLNRSNGLRSSLLSALFFFFSLSSHAASLLQSDTDVATAGYYQLSWSSSEPESVPVVLEESDSDEFLTVKELYHGRQLSSVISGKQDGIYYYRIKSHTSQQVEYSEPVKVTVRHHTLYKAWWFFLLGASVFLGTVGVIYWGNRAAGHGDG